MQAQAKESIHLARIERMQEGSRVFILCQTLLAACQWDWSWEITKGLICFEVAKNYSDDWDLFYNSPMVLPVTTTISQGPFDVVDIKHYSVDSYWIWWAWCRDISDKLVKELIHGGVFDVRVELWCLDSKWWLDLEVGLISLDKNRMGNG